MSTTQSADTLMDEHVIVRRNYGVLSQSEFLVEGSNFIPVDSTTHEQGPLNVEAPETEVIVPRQERAAVLKAVAFGRSSVKVPYSDRLHS